MIICQKSSGGTKAGPPLNHGKSNVISSGNPVSMTTSFGMKNHFNGYLNTSGTILLIGHQTGLMRRGVMIVVMLVPICIGASRLIYELNAPRVTSRHLRLHHLRLQKIHPHHCPTNFCSVVKRKRRKWRMKNSCQALKQRHAPGRCRQHYRDTRLGYIRYYGLPFPECHQTVLPICFQHSVQWRKAKASQITVASFPGD